MQPPRAPPVPALTDHPNGRHGGAAPLRPGSPSALTAAPCQSRGISDQGVGCRADQRLQRWPRLADTCPAVLEVPTAATGRRASTATGGGPKDGQAWNCGRVHPACCLLLGKRNPREDRVKQLRTKSRSHASYQCSRNGAGRRLQLGKRARNMPCVQQVCGRGRGGGDAARSDARAERLGTPRPATRNARPAKAARPVRAPAACRHVRV